MSVYLSVLYFAVYFLTRVYQPYKTESNYELIQCISYSKLVATCCYVLLKSGKKHTRHVLHTLIVICTFSLILCN